MPAERLSMRQIREVLRLRFASKLSQRSIAKSLGLSQGAVSPYLSRARAAGVVWPLPNDLDDAQLERLLFPPLSVIAADQRPLPDWAWVHRELRRPDVTLALLWEEYRAGAPDGFGYSWFCDLYRAWAGRLKPTMRQTHIAGEKLFVDFAGRTAEVVDGRTGEIIPVQIFVAVLGASSFTYAEAIWSQKLPDWIAAHVRAFAYFSGAARQTVSDNLKAGITKACFYEPMVNRTPACAGAGSMPTWPGTTAPPLSRHGLTSHRTRPRACPRAGGGRGRGAGGRALDFGAAAAPAPALLLAGRTQRRDPSPARRAERPPDARLGDEPAGALRSARPAGTRAAAALPLRIRRMEALPGRPRLP
jgi:transposase